MRWKGADGAGALALRWRRAVTQHVNKVQYCMHPIICTQPRSLELEIPPGFVNNVISGMRREKIETNALRNDLRFW